MSQRGLYNDYGNIVVVEVALKEDRECSLHWNNVFQAVLYILLSIGSTWIYFYKMIEAILHDRALNACSCRPLWSYSSHDTLAWLHYIKWSISDMSLDWFHHDHQWHQNNHVKVKGVMLWHVSTSRKTRNTSIQCYCDLVMTLMKTTITMTDNSWFATLWQNKLFM